MPHSFPRLKSCQYSGEKQSGLYFRSRFTCWSSQEKNSCKVSSYLSCYFYFILFWQEAGNSQFNASRDWNFSYEKSIFSSGKHLPVRHEWKLSNFKISPPRCNLIINNWKYAVYIVVLRQSSGDCSPDFAVYHCVIFLSIIGMGHNISNLCLKGFGRTKLRSLPTRFSKSTPTRKL